MPGGANLSVTDMRRAARHPVDFPAIVEHFVHGDLHLHVCNLSAHGFMVDNGGQLQRGDRIRLDDFVAIIDELPPTPRLRRPR